MNFSDGKSWFLLEPALSAPGPSGVNIEKFSVSIRIDISTLSVQ